MTPNSKYKIDNNFFTIRLPDFTYDGKIAMQHHFRDDSEGVDFTKLCLPIK